MAIALGDVTFDEAHTTVREKHAEIGGCDARVIEITGVIVGEHAVSDIEARLDAILAAAPEEACEAELSLRAGRRLLVRRQEFSREVARDSLVGSFVLKLAAEDPFEESSTVTSEDWTVTESGDTKELASEGTVAAASKITLVAVGSIVNPSFSDGTRTICYCGTVADGETLVFDGGDGVVTLEGDDVMPYVSGVFPKLSPEGTTLTYEDDASSSHTASVTVAFRDRWY